MSLLSYLQLFSNQTLIIKDPWALRSHQGQLHTFMGKVATAAFEALSCLLIAVLDDGLKGLYT